LIEKKDINKNLIKNCFISKVDKKKNGLSKNRQPIFLNKLKNKIYFFVKV